MNATMRLLAAGLAGLMSGCVTNIPQDSHSGPDKRPKGAKAVKLDDSGEGIAKDIVTYPGGDRVDWKFFEIQKPGDVDVDLKWKPPRPGLDLSFNVTDANYHVIKRVKPSTNGRPHKMITLEGLQPGKYFVQVYASTRGDAGDYKLDVMWHEIKAKNPVGDSLPMPPNLPGVPNAPASTAAASGAPGSSAASSAMAGGPASSAVSSAAPAKPIKANIIKMNVAGDTVILVIDKGKGAGVDKNWNGVILVGNTEKPLKDSQFAVYSVTDDESYGKVKKLSIDEIGDNGHVLLTPPAAAGP